MDSTGWLCIALVILLALSAFFSASETAYSTVNKIRLHTLAQIGNKRARKAITIIHDYDKLISTILIGNNIVNIAASSIATVLAIRFLPAQFAATVSTVAMTVLVLLFGEVTPKSYAKANAEKISLAFSSPMHMLLLFFTPFSKALVYITRMVTRASGSASPSVTEEELKYIIDTTVEEGVLHENESDLLHSAMEFNDIRVQEVLTPRVDVVAIDIDDDPICVRELVVSERYSRIPVYAGSMDKIIGVLYTRAYLEKLVVGEHPDVRGLLSECLYTHRTMRISSLLADFKRLKINMAVVMDDYGGTMGVVTTEDILEELVGEIWDEDEEIVSDFVQLSDGRYEVAGEYTVREMLDDLDMEDDAIDTESNTVGGWAMEMLGHIPNVGEIFRCGRFTVTVRKVDEQRIYKLLIEVEEDAGRDG